MHIQQLFLIEDDEDDQDIFCMALTKVAPSIFCHTARNGVEATEYLLSGKPLPDVIFLDVNMPFMNGMEFMKWRLQHPRLQHVPVFVYTTTSNSLTEAIMKQLGAARFITKPNTLEGVIHILQDIFASSPSNK